MNKLIVIYLLLILTACSAGPKTQTETPDIQATISAGIEQTQISIEQRATNTPLPTSTLTDTPEPTATNTEIPTQPIETHDSRSVDGAIAKNFVTSNEENGINIEIVRIIICEPGWSTNNFEDKKEYKGRKAYIEFMFRITNNTGKIINTQITDTIAAVDGEQISFMEFYAGRFGDDLRNEILPGSIVIGGLWAGLSRSEYDEIEKIIISIPYFYDKDYKHVTNDLLITIDDVKSWGFEPIADELKN